MSILERTGKMISQIQYSNGLSIDYPKLLEENFVKIETYNNEIEVENKLYGELIRFRSQELFNALNK